MSLMDNLAADIHNLRVRGVKAAVKRAISETSRLMDEWKNRYFPRDTGNLIRSSSITPDFSTIALQLAVGVDYAIFVNRMRGVNWTNPQTVEQFMDNWVQFGREVFLRELRRELGNLGTQNLRVTVT